MGSDEESVGPCARVAAAEVAAAADDDETVTVPDPVLLEMLEDHLGLGPGEPVTRGALRSLRKLSASRLDTQAAPIRILEGLQYATGLRELSLWGNEITDAGMISFAGFDSLWYLSLGANRLTEVDLSELGSLETLSLKANRITSLDDLDGLGDLSRLKRLYLTANPLSGPQSVPNLECLEILHVREAGLSGITLASLPKLRELDLRGNTLSALSLGDKPALETLVLTRNRVKSWALPAQSAIPSLTKLLINDQRVAYTSLDGDRMSITFPNANSTLEDLHLQYNDVLNDLDIANLTGLRTLDITASRICSTYGDTSPSTTTTSKKRSRVTVNAGSAQSGFADSQSPHSISVPGGNTVSISRERSAELRHIECPPSSVAHSQLQSTTADYVGGL